MSWGSPTLLGSANSNTSSSTATITGITVAEGTLIVLVGGARSSLTNMILTVTDSESNSYEIITHYTTSDGYCSFIAYALATAALSSGTITVNDQSGHTFSASAIAAFSVTGGLSANPEDISAEATSDSTTATTTPAITSGVPSTAGDMFWSVYGFRSSNSGNYTEDSNWTNAITKVGNANITMSAAYLINASATTVTHAPTTASSEYSQVIVAFSALGSSPAKKNKISSVWMGGGRRII